MEMQFRPLFSILIGLRPRSLSGSGNNQREVKENTHTNALGKNAKTRENYDSIGEEMILNFLLYLISDDSIGRTIYSSLNSLKRTILTFNLLRLGFAQLPLLYDLLKVVSLLYDLLLSRTILNQVMMKDFHLFIEEKLSSLCLVRSPKPMDLCPKNSQFYFKFS